MRQEPTVSVVLPTYNSAHLLDDAISSVLGQTYKDFEFLIVDNKSTDHTDEIVKKYQSDPRIIYIKNDQNIGLTGNWNKCLELANGKYIKFICSDDKFHPQILEKFVPVLDEYPDVSLVGCYKEEFGGYSRLWEAPFRHQQPGKKVVLETVKDFNYLGEPTCVMFRKADVPKVGGFKNYRWITDWEMWVRLLSIGDCYMVPERLCFTRNHPGQLTKGIWLEYVHLVEEYELFKNLKEGAYSFDFSGEEHVLDNAIKNRAIGYMQVLPKSMVRFHQPKFRKSIKRAVKIAYAEKVVGKSVSVIIKKVTRKIFPSLLPSEPIDGRKNFIQ